ncbi:Glycoside hydrolase- superfamily [Apiospora rasikravindrae]|uniref:Glycoside hydrolase- superfamily n=1 Tax=Apiospora rasikravindrae TaxID=990691 RepID=A0ABR1TE49_9PEZI
MFYSAALLALLSSTALMGTAQAAEVQGFDISHYQPNVNFRSAYSAGARFVIIKVWPTLTLTRSIPSFLPETQTETTGHAHPGTPFPIDTSILTHLSRNKATDGTSFIDPKFSEHWTGASSAGLIRGAYHFARPNSGSGSAQAAFFLAHGGGWTKDGMTLPGMLDLEEGSSQCYGLSASAMVTWIRDFSNTYHAKTGRYPMIYTNPSWWMACTNSSKEFAKTNPLVLARYSSSIGTIPGGWPYQTIWQYTNKYAYGGDGDKFNGDEAGLKKLAASG